MSIDQIQIGTLTFHTYGFLIGLAIVMGMLVIERVVEKYYLVEYLNKRDVERSAFYIVFFGLLGARLYHVVDYWDMYLKTPLKTLMIWNGGLGIYGGILGGILGALIYTNKSFRKIKHIGKRFFGLIDVVSVGLPLSQAIGRLGNFVNQEIYGTPTNSIFGIYIEKTNRLEGYENFAYFHPLFLYEGLWNLLGFIILFWLMKKNRLVKGKGNYFFLYILWYGFGRAVLEPLRIRYWSVGGMPVATIIGACIMIFALIVIVRRKKNNEWAILAN